MSIYDDKNIKPMLLEEQPDPFDNENYIFEIKFDGVRALIFAEPDKVLIKSRRDNILNNSYPELTQIKSIVKNKVIFDGEIVYLDNGIPSFEKLQKRFRVKSPEKIKEFEQDFPVKFICFDILYEDKDITGLTLIERKKILSKYPDNEYFEKIKYIEGKGKSLFKIVKKVKLEGIIAKDKKSTYSINERTSKWIKIKNLKDNDYFIGGYDNNENAMCVLLVGKKINNNLKYIAKVTLGKKREEYKKVKNCKKINKSPFINFNEKDFIYINPELECTVLFTEKTTSGALRHASFKSLKF